MGATTGVTRHFLRMDHPKGLCRVGRHLMTLARLKQGRPRPVCKETTPLLWGESSCEMGVGEVKQRIVFMTFVLGCHVEVWFGPRQKLECIGFEGPISHSFIPVKSLKISCNSKRAMSTFQQACPPQYRAPSAMAQPSIDSRSNPTEQSLLISETYLQAPPLIPTRPQLGGPPANI